MKISRELQQRNASTNECEPHQWADAASARRVAPPPPVFDVSLGTPLRRFNQMPPSMQGAPTPQMKLVSAGATDPSGLPDWPAPFKSLPMSATDDDPTNRVFYDDVVVDGKEPFCERGNVLDRG